MDCSISWQIIKTEEDVTVDYKKEIPRDPVWYPFTQMLEFTEHSPINIAAAKGCWLEDDQGKRYLDGVSSLWANVHGHRHPVIDRAVAEQMGRVSHPFFAWISRFPRAYAAF